MREAKNMVATAHVGCGSAVMLCHDKAFMAKYINKNIFKIFFSIRCCLPADCFLYSARKKEKGVIRETLTSFCDKYVWLDTGGGSGVSDAFCYRWRTDAPSGKGEARRNKRLGGRNRTTGPLLSECKLFCSAQFCSENIPVINIFAI